MTGTRKRAHKARVLAIVATSILSIFFLERAASAQQTAQDTDKKKTEEIIVTGSRVARGGFDAPQPLTVIDEKQIKDLGLVNVGEVARTIPQNTPFFTETNVGIGNFNVGAQLANLRGLNPFFGTRTLTLVDTKRVVPNSEGGAVDLTLIPSILVARTEVVTGGASAAYGSDAIAGVVNVILDKDLQGIKAQADGGQTFKGDGADYHGALAAGTAFGGDRGHVIIGGEYQKQDQIGPCSKTRDWCKSSWFVGTNSGFASANGFPNFVLAPNGKYTTSDNGVFIPFAGPQQQFDASGNALLPFDPGQFPGGFAQRVGGDGNVLAYDISNIRPEIERYSLLGRIDWRFTDSLKASLEFDHAHSNSSNYPANGALGPIIAPIAPDNAYLSPAVQAAAPFGFLFSRVFMPGIVSALNTTENDINRLVASLDGKLFADWTWDAYYQYGRNENHQKLFHNAVGAVVPNGSTYDFLGWALDAVHQGGNPTNPIVCRATDPFYGPVNPLAAGCVPLDLFGANNASQAAIDYAYRTLKENSVYTQNVVGANIRGTLFEGWAGPFKAATGFEWRKDETETTHDVANQPWYNNYFLSYGGDRSGDIQVYEGYGEVNAPLLKDLPLAKSVELDLAARRTRNEASSPAIGGATRAHDFWTWKIGALWDSLDWLRLRGTFSRDVRAAGFRELFFPTLTSTATVGGFPGAVTNPWNGNAFDGYTNLSGGNPNLAPERADTTTVGVVLSPKGPLTGLRFSADWYQIKLNGAITPPLIGGIPAQLMVDACFNSGGTAPVCSKITGFGTADITQIDQRSLNLGSFTTRGVDFEASYGFDLDKVNSGLAGNINMRMIATYLYDMLIDTGLGTPVLNYHGQSGPVASFGSFNTSPDWQGNFWLTYALNRFSTTLEVKYVGPGTLNALWFTSPNGAASNTLPNSVNNNHVDSRFYFTLSGSYDIPMGGDRSIGVFAVVNNIFNTDPPIAPGGNAFPTNPVFFDTIGPRFRVGVRMSY